MKGGNSIANLLASLKTKFNPKDKEEDEGLLKRYENCGEENNAKPQLAVSLNIHSHRHFNSSRPLLPFTLLQYLLVRSCTNQSAAIRLERNKIKETTHFPPVFLPFLFFHGCWN